MGNMGLALLSTINHFQVLRGPNWKPLFEMEMERISHSHSLFHRSKHGLKGIIHESIYQPNNNATFSKVGILPLLQISMAQIQPSILHEKSKQYKRCSKK